MAREKEVLKQLLRHVGFSLEASQYTCSVVNIGLSAMEVIESIYNFNPKGFPNRQKASEELLKLIKLNQGTNYRNIFNGKLLPNFIDNISLTD